MNLIFQTADNAIFHFTFCNLELFFYRWQVAWAVENTVIICICIASGYGLYLTTTNGVNPYQIAVMAANGEVWNADYAAVGGGRLFGRISSVFGHPMTYGLF